MTETTELRSELFLRFSRRSMLALLSIILVLGGTVITLLLTQAGRGAMLDNLGWWLAPVAFAALVLIALNLGRRRWRPDSPEVRAVDHDEFRRFNMDRAMRWTLISVLLVQWPLALVFGYGLELPAPRGAVAMATASIVLGGALVLTLFLYFDRD